MMTLHLLLSLLLVAPALQESAQDLEAVVDTTAGAFIIRFHAAEAPAHVANFIKLARQGFYNGTAFHSMVAHGVVQGGDPTSRDGKKRAEWGTGGFQMGLKPEISALPFKQGTVVATILPGEAGSAGSQFFVCVTDQLQFSGKFTTFGYVIEGLEVVDKISMTPVDGNQIAQDRIEIKSITVRKIPPPPPVPFTTETVEELRSYQVVMETSKGQIRLEVFPDKAPNHVRHFLRLVSLGAYDKSAVHRVAPGFVIQAGDLNTRSEPIPQTVQKYVTRIRAEINDVKHVAGILSMARGEEIDSAMTSFFIVLADQPPLDGHYTVFGRVNAGMETVQAIAAVPQDQEKPKERIDIYSMKVERRN